MAYLAEFRSQIAARNMAKFSELWQEYCAGDAVESDEIIAILQAMKSSDIVKSFGPFVDTILPLVDRIADNTERFSAMKLVFDIQTTNSAALFEKANTVLRELFPNADLLNDKLRHVGLRTHENFQGCLSNFALLNHFKKGNFVLHTAGWGVGEIADVSFLREQVTVQFEHINGKKEIAFKNAFKTLLPVEKSHFLARRFADPDTLEKEAKESPEKVIRELLQDLGPKSASEIRDEILDLVIPEEDFAKWWQNARARLKKDPLIEMPEGTKEPFHLRKEHVSWQERLEKAFQGKQEPGSVLQAAHSLVRDFPELLKDDAAKATLIERVSRLHTRAKVDPELELQLILFLENPLGQKIDQADVKKHILQAKNIEALLNRIDLLALKKRVLQGISEYREDATDIFLNLLLTLEPVQLRETLFKELQAKKTVALLEKKLSELISHPRKYPEAVFWYFQKVHNDEAPFLTSKEEKYALFEALLSAMSFIEMRQEVKAKDFAKKIYSYLIAERFLLIREMLKDSPEEFAKEFLLLSTKCQSFSEHDKKILQSLVEVAHPKLATAKSEVNDFTVIWTTEEALARVQERIKAIGTVEMCNVAKEIEVARGHGDLRENAEYKAAIERRNRLQGELKVLSQQFNQARIITKDDIASDEVNIGNVVALMGPTGEKISYTILGPWDADVEKNILSFQSKLAQAMRGRKKGEKFQFKGEEFKILNITNFLD